MSTPGDYSSLSSDGGARQLRRRIPGDYSTLRSDDSLEAQIGDLSDDGEFWAGGGPSEGKIGVWAVIKIGGLWFPGQTSIGSPGVIPVVIEGMELEYRIDSQRVKGKGGHKLVVDGYKPTPFTVRGRITTAVQWRAYKFYLPKISPKLHENLQRAYDIEHPTASAYGIRSVFINKMTAPEEADGRMVRDVKLTMWEVFGLTGKGNGKTVAQTDAVPGVIKEGLISGAPQGTVSIEKRRP